MPSVPDCGFTHAGNFHADDVFSAALLRILNPNIHIHRVNDVADISLLWDATEPHIVFDIGGGRFDHHMSPVPMRDNGRPLAAFGLLWHKFGRKLLPRDADWHAIDAFAADLDEADNTGCYNIMSATVAAMNPQWDSNESSDDAFERAVQWATVALKARIEVRRAKQAAERHVLDAMSGQQPPVLVLDRYMPFYDQTIDSDYLYVVYPSERGGWCTCAVPEDLRIKKNKVNFPASWCGSDAETIRRLSGISDATFCHASGFLAVAESRDGAIALAHKSLEAAYAAFEKKGFTL